MAKVWAGLYSRQFGVPVDGVVGVNPEALAHLLRGAAPVVLPDGTQVTADSVTRLLEQGAYERFPEFAQEPARNAFQQQLVGRLLTSLTSTPADRTQLEGLAAAAGDGSLRLASTHPVEEADLRSTTLGGALPENADPFVAWISQNTSASKLDVFLHRTLSATRTPDGPGRERATATAVLRNDAPTAGLAAYVTGDRLHPAGTHRAAARDLPHAGGHRDVGDGGRSPGTSGAAHRARPPDRARRGHARAWRGTAAIAVTSEQAGSDAATSTMGQVMSHPDVIDIARAGRVAATP